MAAASNSCQCSLLGMFYLSVLVRLCPSTGKGTLPATFALPRQPVNIRSLNPHPVCRLLFSFLLVFFRHSSPPDPMRCNFSCHSCRPSPSLFFSVLLFKPTQSHGRQIRGEKKSLWVISQFAAEGHPGGLCVCVWVSGQMKQAHLVIAYNLILGLVS